MLFAIKFEHYKVSTCRHILSIPGYLVLAERHVPINQCRHFAPQHIDDVGFPFFRVEPR